MHTDSADTSVARKADKCRKTHTYCTPSPFATQPRNVFLSRSPQSGCPLLRRIRPVPPICMLAFFVPHAPQTSRHPGRGGGEALSSSTIATRRVCSDEPTRRKHPEREWPRDGGECGYYASMCECFLDCTGPLKVLATSSTSNLQEAHHLTHLLALAALSLPLASE